MQDSSDSTSECSKRLSSKVSQRVRRKSTRCRLDLGNRGLQADQRKFRTLPGIEHLYRRKSRMMGATTRPQEPPLSEQLAAPKSPLASAPRTPHPHKHRSDVLSQPSPEPTGNTRLP